MPKRSAEEKIEHYLRKIKKIEETKKRQRIVRRIDSSTDEEGNGHIDTEIISSCNSQHTECPTTHYTQDITESEEVTPLIEDTVLDPDLLLALGETVVQCPDYGDNIHPNLSTLWLPILKKGMSKEVRDKLLQEYLIPDNCRLLQAPKLNAEIAAAVNDLVNKRDKTITASHQQIGLGITAISRGMDLILKGSNNAEAIKHLSNGCRILCDSHYGVTQTRIKLLTPHLNKTCFNTINITERDETLFGCSLSEKINAAKAIEKQGQQMKKPTKPQKTTASQITRPAINQGNWSTPPRYPSSNRGGRGGAKRPSAVNSGRRRPYTWQTRAATQEKKRQRASTSARR